jgi:hypothetical protein
LALSVGRFEKQQASGQSAGLLLFSQQHSGDPRPMGQSLAFPGFVYAKILQILFFAIDYKPLL